MKIMRFLNITGICALLLASGLVLGAAPAWWSTRSVLNSNPADDYAAANIGQLKYIAKKAQLELNALLPAGAGSDINNLVAAWAVAPVGGVVRDDYAALNQGQLKAIAGLFYNRLVQYGYSGAPLSETNRYPWTSAAGDDDDYALVNLGQLKYVFSFLATGYSLDANKADWDLDYLPDAWESAYGFSTNSNDASDNADGDSLTNLAEYKAGTSPLYRDTNALGLEIYTP